MQTSAKITNSGDLHHLPSNINDIAWRADFRTFVMHAAGDQWQAYKWLLAVMQVVASEILKGDAIIIIEAPPRHGKTYTLSKWLAVWFLELFPEKDVMIGSYAASPSAAISQFVRDEFVINNKLKTKVSQTNSAKNSWRTLAGGGVRSFGVGGTATSFGFDLGIIDDPFKDWADANSPAMRQNVMDFYDGTFARRGEPGSSQVITHTRWNKNDLIGQLCERTFQRKRLTRIRLPAIAGDDDWLGRAPGEPLCPERWPLPELEEVKINLPAMIWAAMYQQRPTPEDGAYFKSDWMQYYTTLPEGLEDIKISFDFAFKKTTSGSYVCGLVWAKKGANKYLLDRVRERMDYTEMRATVRRLANRWPEYSEILVEEAANGAAILSDLKDEIRGMVPIKLKGDSKEGRAAAVTPEFEAGNVWLPHPSICPWVLDYTEELVFFPNGDANDQVDTTSQALLRYRGGKTLFPQVNLDVGGQANPFQL